MVLPYTLKMSKYCVLLTSSQPRADMDFVFLYYISALVLLRLQQQNVTMGHYNMSP